MPRIPWIIKMLLVLAAFLSLFGFATNYHSTTSFLLSSTLLAPTSLFTSRPVLRLKDEATQVHIPSKEEVSIKEESPVLSVEPSILHHPFDNHCKFAMINSYASDINNWKHSERMRQLKCPTDHPMATQDSEGALYVHPHFAYYPNTTEGITCKVEIIEGGLRDKKTNKGKDVTKTVATFDAPENTRFLVNADAFLIRCIGKDKTVVWEKPFAGMSDDENPRNTIIPIPDTPNFDKYGRKLIHRNKKQSLDRLSIDILGFDSTSRSMFQRHMPRTWETMHRLGYEVLYGYNKVGDNSMVNLAPILIGDVKEALQMPKTDVSGDINPQWILPTNLSLDPTMLQFLWKEMKDKYGCTSMLNEDISMKQLGLFHYPAKEFLPGFTESPATHFYRAFYLEVYKNWKYGACRNGDQVQNQFLDLWHRFAKKYKDICHFGFSFITTLTHETGKVLETLDEHLTQRLEDQQSTGALDNSLSIILGDHGNRIGLVQYTYSGRIEERMPLMAIRIPEKIKKEYPLQYANFQKNKHKLTSNFDIHQTLVDIARMEFGEHRPSDGTRGTSLFREIPSNRTCFDAYIPENFCSCLVDRSQEKSPMAGQPAKSTVHRKSKVLLAVRKWISENGLDACLKASSLPVDFSLDTMGINALARHGLRSKGNLTVVENAIKAHPKMDFLFHEVRLPTELIPTTKTVDLLFRVEDNIALDEFSVVFEPSVQNPPTQCPYKSIIDICDCTLAI